MVTRKNPARNLNAWRAKNPAAAVTKLLARRVLGVERQIDQDDQRIFELNSELVEVRNRMQVRTRAAAVALSDLAERLRLAERALDVQKGMSCNLAELLAAAEQNLRDHEQTLGALAVLVSKLLEKYPLVLSNQQTEEHHEIARAAVAVATYIDRSRSATGSSKTSRSRNNASKSAT